MQYSQGTFKVKAGVASLRSKLWRWEGEWVETLMQDALWRLSLQRESDRIHQVPKSIQI